MTLTEYRFNKKLKLILNIDNYSCLNLHDDFRTLLKRINPLYCLKHLNRKCFFFHVLGRVPLDVARPTL